MNAGVIPLWNAASFYVAEPAIVLILEIFSLAFTRQHWQGVFREEDFPYFGLECTSSIQAAQWCGEATIRLEQPPPLQTLPCVLCQLRIHAYRTLRVLHGAVDVGREGAWLRRRVAGLCEPSSVRRRGRSRVHVWNRHGATIERALGHE